MKKNRREQQHTLKKQTVEDSAAAAFTPIASPAKPTDNIALVTSIEPAAASAPQAAADASAAKDEREFWLKEYTLVVDQFHKYYDIHVRGFGVYLGITSVLFAFAVKETPDKKSVLATYGFFFSLAYYVVLLCSLHIVTLLCRRRERALGHIGHPEIDNDLHPTGRWSTYIYMGIIVAISCGWLYVIYMPEPPAAEANKASTQSPGSQPPGNQSPGTQPQAPIAAPPAATGPAPSASTRAPASARPTPHLTKSQFTLSR